MRFEEEYDPDPLREKYQSFEGISHLPDEIKAMVETSYTKIEKSISEYEELNPGKLGPQAYMAVQDVQITALQKEIKTILQSLLNIAIRVDSITDGDS